MRILALTSIAALAVSACTLQLPNSGATADAEPVPAAAPPAPETAAATPPPAPALEILPFEQAVQAAADGLFSRARAAGVSGSGGPRLLVIDPLIDGVTGIQSITSRSMEADISNLVRANYGEFNLQPFNTANVARNPIVLVGTFTGVNGAGKTEGVREAG